jgi:hypothetical protein
VLVTSASAAYQTVDVRAAVVYQPASVEPIEHLRAAVRGLPIDHFSLLGKPPYRDGILASHMQAESGTFFCTRFGGTAMQTLRRSLQS